MVGYRHSVWKQEGETHWSVSGAETEERSSSLELLGTEETCGGGYGGLDRILVVCT